MALMCTLKMYSGPRNKIVIKFHSIKSCLQKKAAFFMRSKNFGIKIFLIQKNIILVSCFDCYILTLLSFSQFKHLNFITKHLN